MTSAEAGSSTGGIGFFEVLVETENAQFSVRGASCADLLQRHHKSRVTCVRARARVAATKPKNLEISCAPGASGANPRLWLFLELQ